MAGIRWRWKWKGTICVSHSLGMKCDSLLYCPINSESLEPQINSRLSSCPLICLFLFLHLILVKCTKWLLP